MTHYGVTKDYDYSATHKRERLSDYAVTPIEVGKRVKVDELQSGYVSSIDHGWAAIVLDRHAHRNNAPIYWAKLSELELEA